MRVESTNGKRFESDIAVGVVVPPDNHVADAEAVAALRRTCTVHVARLPPARSLPMRQRHVSYGERLGEPVDELASSAPVATLVACTGSSYLLGPEEDDRLFADHSARVGSTVRGVCQCIRDHLGRLGAKHIVLVSPYEAWLTDLSVAYWSAAGLIVTDVHEVGGGRHPYEIGEPEMEEAISRIVASSDGTVLVTGTGVATVAAIERLGRSSAPPVVSSMQCGIDWLRSMVEEAAKAPRSIHDGNRGEET